MYIIMGKNKSKGKNNMSIKDLLAQKYPDDKPIELQEKALKTINCPGGQGWDCLHWNQFKKEQYF